MPVAVVADAHLGGPGGGSQPLVDQLDDLDRTNCERLLLMGDLFQVWVGTRRFETEDIRRISDALRRLREREVPVHYIEGNRDFFLAGSCYEDLFETIGDELVFDHAGKRFLAVHGDGINKKDYLYRFWRRLSKNPISRLAMLNLPRRLAGLLIFGFERELGKTNFKHKHRLPAEVIAEYGDRRLAEGHDVLLLGHFHDAFRRRVASGEIIVFDAWFRSRRVEWIDERKDGASDEQSA